MTVDDDVTLGEVVRLFTRIEQKLDTVTGDHERRLRTLEKWMYAVPPTVLIAVGSLIAAWRR